MSAHVRERPGPISKSKNAAPSTSGSRASDNLDLMEHLGQLFDVTQDLLCVLGFDDGIKYLNHSWESALGYTQEEVKTTPPDALVHPDDRVAARADIEKQKPFDLRNLAHKVREVLQGDTAVAGNPAHHPSN